MFSPAIEGYTGSITFQLDKANSLLEIDTVTGVIVQTDTQVTKDFSGMTAQVTYKVTGDSTPHKINLEVKPGLYYSVNNLVGFTGDAKVDNFLPDMYQSIATKYSWELSANDYFQINPNGKITVKDGVLYTDIKRQQLTVTAKQLPSNTLVAKNITAQSRVAFSRQIASKKNFVFPGYGTKNDYQDYDDKIYIQAGGSGQKFTSNLGGFGFSCTGMQGLPYFMDFETPSGTIIQKYPVPTDFRECTFQVSFGSTYGEIIKTPTLGIDDVHYQAAQTIFNTTPSMGDKTVGNLALEKVLNVIKSALMDLPEPDQGLSLAMFKLHFFPSAQPLDATEDKIKALHPDMSWWALLTSL